MERKDKMLSIAPLHYKYSSLPIEDIPDKYNLFPISFRSDEIRDIEVLFLHRLLRRNCGLPADIEAIEVKREINKDGHITAVGIRKEWKYYLRTPSGGIIQIGTEKLHRFVNLFHVLPESITEPDGRLIKEGERFVNDLLLEASRLKGQILNPRKEFEEGEGVQLYMLDNVYKINYGSAELMLEDAEDYENDIFYEYQRFLPDIYTSYTSDPEKLVHIDKYLAGLGMYYRAIILFYGFGGFCQSSLPCFSKTRTQRPEFGTTFGPRTENAIYARIVQWI